jgi:hypothetical protein
VLGLSPWLSLLAVLLAVLLSRVGVRGDDTRAGALARMADAVRDATASRWAPWLVGVATGAVTWYVWGSLNRSAVVHDETAYLLQAELFARLAWTAPAPSLPQFFEQLYVNLAPALSSKYPPGTSLLLAPGVMLGLPGLPVVLMNAGAGALLFVIARRIAGGLVALLAWTMWVTSFPVLYFHAMYLSEVPSSLAWLGAWWALLRWRERRRERDLWLAASAVALCGITRPLTSVALALFAGAFVIVSVARGEPIARAALVRTARPFAVVAVVAALFVALWSWRSTGDARTTPLALYTRTYVPFDRLGFGARTDERPSARLPWDQRVTSESFYEEHRRHTPSALPIVAYSRARMIAHDMWYDWRGGLAVFAVIGLIAAPFGLWAGLGALATQVTLYLLYAHPWTWSLYYIETLPVLALLTALGIARVSARVVAEGTRERGLALVTLLLAVAVVYPAQRTMRMVHDQIALDHGYYDGFTRLLPTVPSGAIVFVRYARTHNDGLSLVRNPADRDAAPVWTVYDRGAENERLAALAPARARFLFDEATWTLRPLARTSRAMSTASAGCALSRDDSLWTAGALEAWTRVGRQSLGAPQPVFPRLVLFDSLCSHTLTATSLDAAHAGFVGAGQAFTVVSRAHGGTIALPDGKSVPARLTSFAAPLPDGRMFFVMALPSVWRSSGRASPRDLLATAVFVHEFTHTQSRSLGERVDSLMRRGLPEDADDDVVQTRFASRPGFRAAYEAERDLLFAAAAAPDRATTLSLAQRALQLMDRRRARYFRGADAVYAGAEDVFLSMEGMGQWAGYLAMLDSAGGAMRPEAALPFMRRGGKHWSQDEGLALMLVLGRLAPVAPAALFASPPGTVLELLRDAVTECTPH